MDGHNLRTVLRCLLLRVYKKMIWTGPYTGYAISQLFFVQLIQGWDCFCKCQTYRLRDQNMNFAVNKNRLRDQKVNFALKNTFSLNSCKNQNKLSVTLNLAFLGIKWFIYSSVRKFLSPDVCFCYF